jgi:hypothetical protein
MVPGPRLSAEKVAALTCRPNGCSQRRLGPGPELCVYQDGEQIAAATVGETVAGAGLAVIGIIVWVAAALRFERRVMNPGGYDALRPPNFRPTIDGKHPTLPDRKVAILNFASTTYRIGGRKMKPGSRQYLMACAMLTGAVFGVAGSTPTAAAVCPPVGIDTDCGILITLFPGSISVVALGHPPYTGDDDTLIGVVNLSGAPVGAITITSPITANNIFMFDGDGLQTFINPPTGGATGYEGADSLTSNFDVNGPMNFFSNIDLFEDTGTVVFGLAGLATSCLADGGSAFFSLESLVTPNNISVKGAPSPCAVSEPASILLLGVGLIGLGLFASGFATRSRLRLASI